MSSPMQPLVKIGHQPHPVARKYGLPRFAVYYANRSRFTQPGIYVWTGKRNLRVIPLRRRGVR